MRDVRTSILAALTILLVAALAGAQPAESPPLPGYGWGAGRGFDPAALETIGPRGHERAVSGLAPGPRGALERRDGRRPGRAVHVGPQWYLQRKGVAFAAGERRRRPSGGPSAGSRGREVHDTMWKNVRVVLFVAALPGLALGCRGHSSERPPGARGKAAPAPSPDPVARGEGRRGPVEHQVPRRGFGRRTGRGWGRHHVLLTPDEERMVHVSTVAAEYRPLRSRLQAMGTVYAPPDRKAVVGSAFPAGVGEVLVRVGQWVRRGQRLVVLNAETVGEAKSAYLEGPCRARAGREQLRARGAAPRPQGGRAQELPRCGEPAEARPVGPRVGREADARARPLGGRGRGGALVGRRGHEDRPLRADRGEGDRRDTGRRHDGRPFDHAPHRRGPEDALHRRRGLRARPREAPDRAGGGGHRSGVPRGDLPRPRFTASGWSWGSSSSSWPRGPWPTPISARSSFLPWTRGRSP